MNLYFLVEGKRTEMRILPEWLKHFLPHYSRIKNPYDASHNNYYLISGYGYPSILEYIEDAITEINEIDRFDYFFICIDADEFSIEERKEEVVDWITNQKLHLQFCELKIIVQNRCIETWLLGNTKVYPRQPDNPIFIKYAGFYNVAQNDPELMGVYEGFRNHASFHESYLKLMLLERNIRYSKQHPRGVTDVSYLEELVQRCKTNLHLASFRIFVDIIEKIREGTINS